MNGFNIVKEFPAHFPTIRGRRFHTAYTAWHVFKLITIRMSTPISLTDGKKSD